MEYFFQNKLYIKTINMAIISYFSFYRVASKASPKLIHFESVEKSERLKYPVIMKIHNESQNQFSFQNKTGILFITTKPCRFTTTLENLAKIIKNNKKYR